MDLKVAVESVANAEAVIDHLEAVLVTLHLHGVDHSKLQHDSTSVIKLVEATAHATAKFAGVDTEQVISLPSQGLARGTTQLSLQIFVPMSQKHPLVSKVQEIKAKAFEAV